MSDEPLEAQVIALTQGERDLLRLGLHLISMQALRLGNTARAGINGAADAERYTAEAAKADGLRALLAAAAAVFIEPSSAGSHPPADDGERPPD